MRARRENLNVIFGKITPEMLAQNVYSTNEKDISYQYIPEDLYIMLSASVKKEYSKDERGEQYKILCKDMSYDGYEHKAPKSVFNLLYEFSNSVLTTRRYVPICKYDQLLRWNDTSHDLGQAMFTTSYLAFKDYYEATETNYFGWNAIIDTTNDRLYKILNKGLAENHYHFYGSSQCFPLNWVAIMNNPYLAMKENARLNYSLNPRLSYSSKFERCSWNHKLVWAAAIRCYLFKKMHIGFDTESKTFKVAERNLKFLLKTSTEREIQPILKVFEREINSLKLTFGKVFKDSDACLDYAILKNMHHDNFNFNRILVGERKFLYDCFKAYAKNKLTRAECNLFYLYLLIKVEFRNEFIQTNKEFGFKNFSDYQSRKSLFLEEDNYNQEAIRLALTTPLSTQPIKSLEARITPQENPDAMKSQIISIDEIYENDTKPSTPSPRSKHTLRLHRTDKKHFFVIHYPKRKYTLERSRYAPLCRNHELREVNKQRTDTLVNLLKNDIYMRDAIKGIDACSNEIGCRPEVFATDFRYLREVIPANKKYNCNRHEKPAQLKLTYHAGEDFLNITDGLRAIDEAILFLNMQRCDRLGHALALGVDVDQYYALKDYRVIMPKQDILDDDVWLLYKANELNVPIEKSLEQKLIYRIQDYIRYIYGNALKKYNIQADHFVYYNSWMLRGDHPELYKKYRFDDSKMLSYGYTSHMLNKKLPSHSIRYDNDAAALYGIYHFDDEAKKHGLETDVIKITHEYISLVKGIQKRMQFIIAEKGIMIECNPSSNYLIGTFRKYDSHPIIKFNNAFLEYREENISKCAQLSVSINTDDQGVFDTSLVNEYALLALALEKKKDENGKHLYSANNVYQYLDYVRNMGFEQSFSDFIPKEN